MTNVRALYRLKVCFRQIRAHESRVCVCMCSCPTCLPAAFAFSTLFCPLLRMVLMRCTHSLLSLLLVFLTIMTMMMIPSMRADENAVAHYESSDNSGPRRARQNGRGHRDALRTPQRPSARPGILTAWCIAIILTDIEPRYTDSSASSKPLERALTPPSSGTAIVFHVVSNLFYLLLSSYSQTHKALALHRRSSTTTSAQPL